MRLLLLLTVLVFCTSLANGMWKGKKYGVYKYKVNEIIFILYSKNFSV